MKPFVNSFLLSKLLESWAINAGLSPVKTLNLAVAKPF